MRRRADTPNAKAIKRKVNGGWRVKLQKSFKKKHNDKK